HVTEGILEFFFGSRLGFDPGNQGNGHIFLLGFPSGWINRGAPHAERFARDADTARKPVIVGPGGFYKPPRPRPAIALRLRCPSRKIGKLAAAKIRLEKQLRRSGQKPAERTKTCGAYKEMIGFELTEEQNDLRRLAREFAEQEMIPRAREYDEKETFPRDVCEAAFKAGLMNLGVPREQGGPGLNILDSAIIIEELNYGCSGMANAIGANELATLPLVVAGNEEQKSIYLGRLVKELTLCAFAITEPGAGSDVAAMSTTYRREGDSFVLNGTKHFISNGSMADWYVTFATSDRKLKHKGISCFVFPANLPGITRRRMHGKLGQRAADTGEIVYDELRIPASALVGREGEGFKYAMATFDRSRPEIGAIATGVAQRALDECVKYSQQRRAFGAPIASFQAIQFMMADMAVAV